MVLDAKYSQECPVNDLVCQGSILGATLFLLYMGGLLDDVICSIAIYVDDTTFYFKYGRHLIFGNNLNWLLNLNII